MSELATIIDETIQSLEAMKRDGVTHVEVSAETMAELGKKPVFVKSTARPVVVEGERPREPFPSVARADARPPSAVREVSVPAISSDLAALAARAKACTKCSELSRCRHTVVFGVGNPQAELMFIGEAPGHDEDIQGEPFVGRAGQLLTKIIQAMGFERSDIYICNVLKCRPPENRTPLPDEVQNCLPFLLAQIDAIKPKVIVGLGATAVRSLLDVQIGITKMRGNWYTFHGVPIMPTFHPAYLLRNPPAKKEVWEDMQAVVAKLGRELPEASRNKTGR